MGSRDVGAFNILYVLHKNYGEEHLRQADQARMLTPFLACLRAREKERTRAKSSVDQAIYLDVTR